MDFGSRTIAAVCFLLIGASGVWANDFYAGKTVEMIVGSDVGGGYDIYIAALAWHDAAAAARDYTAMPDAEVTIAARNREALARFAWSPYMHDPKLPHRLHRIRIPTLFLWGASDRILSEPYGRAYCALIPGAKFEPIEQAGHFPHLEQPEQFARRVLAFAGIK